MNSSLQIQNTVLSPCCSFYFVNGGIPDQFSTLAYTVIAFTIAFNATTFPFTVVLNLLVMIAVATKARLQSMSNLALACLATTDLMVGFFVQPLQIALTVKTLKRESTSEACSIQMSTMYYYFLRLSTWF